MSAWIFGYGSLVWRPDFPHDRAEVAWVDGWARRFWQGSPDHRGTPEAPGRVVTLIPSPGERVGGLAYHVPAEHLDDVVARLDHREKAGYASHGVPLTLADGVVEGRVYVATEGNADWLGPAPLDAIALHIARASGPSGTNRAYLLRLAEALRSHGMPDPHVAALEDRVLRLPTPTVPRDRDPA